MKNKFTQALLGVAFVFLCFKGFQSWSVETEFEEAISKTIAIKKDEHLKMDFSIGMITIEASDEFEQIEYQAQFKLTGKAAEKQLKALDLFVWEFDSDEEGEVIRMDWKDKKWLKGWNVSVKHTLKVPSEINIEARTAGGKITVSDLNGDLKAQTSGGSIEIGEINGIVDVKTSGGTIKAQSINGSATLQTSGGSIKAGNINGPLNARTSGGSIAIESVFGKLEARTSGGSIKSKLTQHFNESVVMETSGGSISLILPEGFGAELSAKTSGGRVSCQLPFIGKSKKSNMEGTINQGGPEVRLRTSGGSISVLSE
jgi:DUF4097 and DUF4098 domain-containing protein YvlB